MKYLSYPILFFYSLLSFQLGAQTDLKIEENLFQIESLNEAVFQEFTEERLENSQFVFVGEQHGIKEVGVFTNAIYSIAQKYSFDKLCIETDAVAANMITEIAKSENWDVKAKDLYKEYPFSIPFYNNAEDYDLFKNVIDSGGSIWGIDQTFMVQFRLNFDYLIRTTGGKGLKSKLKPLKVRAKESYDTAISSKDFSATYIFKYDRSTHDELLKLAESEEEEEILNQFWWTKEIYGYNNTKKYYKNNSIRAKLMKRNFIRYYKDAYGKEKDLPKVVFKLGAYHATKGLTKTNVYDISNFASEFAQFNGMESVHYMVVGISGKAMVGNPFAPNSIADFNNIEELPMEIQELIPSFSKKYIVLHLAPLREYGYGKKYSKELKNLIFGYDVLVLVNNAEANTPF